MRDGGIAEEVFASRTESHSYMNTYPNIVILNSWKKLYDDVYKRLGFVLGESRI